MLTVRGKSSSILNSPLRMHAIYLKFSIDFLSEDVNLRVSQVVLSKKRAFSQYLTSIICQRAKVWDISKLQKAY